MPGACMVKLFMGGSAFVSKKTIVLLALAAILCGSVLLGIGVGAVQLSPGEVWRALFYETEGINRQIIWNVRLPRALTGVMAGACLAVSGGILQGVLRNPLASPSVLGVSSGAGFFGVLVLTVFPSQYGFLTPVAFAGGLVTALLIYLMAWRSGINPTRMILAGTAVSAFLRAGIDALMLLFSDDINGIMNFTVGGLGGATWRHCKTLAPYAAVGLLLAAALSSRINILMLGDDVSVGLGLPVERTRLLCLSVSALLAASAVSVVGLLGFVGLIAPHMVRLVIGSDQRLLLPASALFGGALVVACDTLGKLIMPPAEIPVGIVMAVLGAPFFIFLLRGRSKRHAAGQELHHRIRRKNRNS